MIDTAAIRPELIERLLDFFKKFADICHHAKDNKVLFPMADRILSGADQGRLQEASARVEEIKLGQGVHDKYHQLAHMISEFS